MSHIEDPKQLSLRTAQLSNNALGINAPPSPANKSASADSSVHYTCFIRLPFARGDFVDPPQVDWNSTKDRALWKIISKASNSKELDWEDLSVYLSARFEVSLAFLLQQAAWLYERHFAQMKAQMKKLSPSACPSPMPPDSTGNVALNSNVTAFPVASQGQRAPSSLSAHMRDSPTPTMGSVSSAVFRQPPTTLPSLSTTNQPQKTEGGLSRTPSTRTLTQSRIITPVSSAQASSARTFNTAFGNHRKPISPQREISEPDSDVLQDSDSSSSSDGESQSIARSQAFRRPSHYPKTARHGYDDDDEDEDAESSGGFLPFATTATGSADGAATIKSPVKRVFEQRPAAPDSSASSASSAAAPSQPTTNVGKHRESNRGDYTRASPASALSPRHRSELSKLSPRVRKDGSEGTPSMGSSFSDLDDASISQSAIEEAFMSHMQHGSGSTTSRMSSISQALRSKYL
ncbi:hypothetical protein M436DRAFT_62834 [Aureobasidium namibiae CBS 147.97]|uniref:Autophagy-related protein 29 n=1 Tax=Aureobasidium namibiae CBS 147.97 TaxID=1043004 RepID=A0A074WMS5_9PEZI|nr:uncharacterized protein M436DRAFT_62834 [Aureobasidium namibiae CBS 147.97]KEQ74443.1 hypothetical protein M436DRAFT_62834 [Aureobasidium namibiae CBS 147.97]